MKLLKIKYLLLFFIAFATNNLVPQERKTIEIKDSGAFGDIDEVNFPGASILTRSDQGQVHIYHDGIDLFCDKVIFYGKEDFVEAYGNVIMKQGDTLNLMLVYLLRFLHFNSQQSFLNLLIMKQTII